MNKGIFNLALIVTGLIMYNEVSITLNNPQNRPSPKLSEPRLTFQNYNLLFLYCIGQRLGIYIL